MYDLTIGSSDGSEQLWVWEYKNEDDEVHDMFMDTEEEIRFCVTDETFVDTVPNSDQPPSMVGGAEAAIPEKKQIPYTITVRVYSIQYNVQSVGQLFAPNTLIYTGSYVNWSDKMI